MLVNNAIIHKLISEQHKREVQIFPRQTEINLPNTNAHNLLDSIVVSYKKDTDIAYAGFDEKKWFPEQLKRFLLEEINFYDFSVSCLNQLKDKMELVSPATGGYLVMYYYTENENNFLIVILLKDREGMFIDENLDIVSIQNLDLERLHFAAKIDASRFLNEDADTILNPISFLKGKNRVYVVEYFKNFLGIDEENFLDYHQSNLEFINAVKDFAETKDSFKKRGEILDRIHLYAKTQIENGKAISLNTLANLASPEDPDVFIAFINDNKKEIPGEFPGEENQLNKLLRFHSKTQNYSITFYKHAIDNGTITMNGPNQLIINEVTDNIRKLFNG